MLVNAKLACKCLIEWQVAPSADNDQLDWPLELLKQQLVGLEKVRDVFFLVKPPYKKRVLISDHALCRHPIPLGINTAPEHINPILRDMKLLDDLLFCVAAQCEYFLRMLVVFFLKHPA